jgi:hypothetical protein
MIVSEQRVPVNEEGLAEENFGFRIFQRGGQVGGVLDSQFSIVGAVTDHIT